MVYSPLEQFEPVSLFSIFLGNINLSITNISLMFIFMIVIFSFLLNGYVFYFKNATNTLKFNVNSSKVYSVESLNNSPLNGFNNTGLSSNNNIAYLNQVYARFNTLAELSNFKSVKTNISLNLENKFVYLFLSTFYSFLRSKKFEVKKNNFIFLTSYFNTIVKGLKVKNKLTLHKFFNNLSAERGFNRTFVPTAFIYVFESIFDSLLAQVKDTISGDNKNSVKFFPVIFLLFNFILLANLLGLIPYSSTVTAYIIITFTLAFMV